MRAATIHEQQRLRLLARAVIVRHYRRPLTLAVVARALSSSPRQLQRAYARCGTSSFSEDLLAVRMSVAAQLLIEQPAIPIADVARLVGYRRATHFARAFRHCYGLPPAVFRKRGRSAWARRAAKPSSAPAASSGKAPACSVDCRGEPGTHPDPAVGGAPVMLSLDEQR